MLSPPRDRPSASRSAGLPGFVPAAGGFLSFGAAPDAGRGAQLRAYWQEHREQFRQSENQRAVLTNYVLAIAAAISGLVVQQDFKLRTLPLSVLISVIGL